jgi:Uma2 family endonuclease
MSFPVVLEPSPDTTVQKLLRSPKLPFYVQQFQSLLDAEREKREHFYEGMTESDKVEFINGEVVVHSPVLLRHLTASSNLLSLLGAYVRKYQLGTVGYEKMLIALTRNDYEPNICFFRKERAQHFTSDQMKFPAPDFIVEILSPSTEKYDWGIKLEDYALHSVAEYWIIDPDKETVEQYLLSEEKKAYELGVKVNSGLITSSVIDGFSIPVRALFDEQAQWMTLQEIIEKS